MVKVFKEEYGDHSLDEFGAASYQGTLTSIMYDYWRSYLAVQSLVEERASHDIMQIFKEYHNWHNDGRKQPLTEYFSLDSLF
ncbi:hypothetical protein [Salinibacillus kushneri]|uniref:hypothetical protein n=1 Tax=Salinibacillus kushneri TaxID=237682 RepID=UPI000A4174E9|nr:hypothetical protein [Salinibacillus kushneri]